MPTIKHEDFISASKAGLDLALFFANTSLASIERLAALNLNAARSIIEESLAISKALLNAKDLQSFLSVQSSLTQPAIEKTVAYSRNVFEITSEAKENIAKVVESKIADANNKVSGMVQKALDQAPAGSEVAVAAVKSAIAASNSAYEGINKAAKQVAEIAEANVAAATSATVKAAAAVATKEKKTA